jgi:hypothetical protein
MCQFTLAASSDFVERARRAMRRWSACSMILAARAAASPAGLREILAAVCEGRVGPLFAIEARYYGTGNQLEKTANTGHVGRRRRHPANVGLRWC